MRHLVMQLLKLVFRVFFTRGDVVGQASVPRTGPLMMVVNHPNALIDPLCLYVLSPRPVAFLAKSTLFKIPLVGHIARAMDSLPVYRRQDVEADPCKNLETFALARDLLQRGGSLAVFPEGVSHDATTLRPLKTGTARIALGAAALQSDTDMPMQIVPATLFYTDKRTMRSSVLLQFGTPIVVPRLPLAGEEPPIAEVRELTDKLSAALGALTLQHERSDFLPLLARAAEILASDTADRSLAANKQWQERVAAAHKALAAKHAAAVEALISAVRDYDAALLQAGIAPGMPPEPGSVWTLAGLWPLALPGIVVHYPAYRLVGRIAMQKAGDEQDMIATIKVVAGLVLFPLTYALVTVACWWLLPGLWHLVLLLMPLTGYAALLWTEAWENRLLHRRWRVQSERLHTQRERIRRDMATLAAALETEQ